MKRVLGIVLVLMLCAFACAETASVGLKIEYSDTFGGCKVVGRGDCTDETIVIPDEYEGQPVVFIMPEAFLNDETLKKIVLPDTLTDVGDKAFAGCSNLEYNELNGAKYLGSADNPYLMLWGILDDAITELAISEQTKIVYPAILSGRTQLASITIPEGVGQMASLGGCTSLKEVMVPASVGSIGSMFYDCTALEKVVCVGMPAFDEATFSGCTSLKEIHLQPEGFSDPRIPRSACEGGFINLPALTDIYFGGTMDEFYSRTAADILVSSPVTVHCTDGVIALTVV